MFIKNEISFVQDKYNTNIGKTCKRHTLYPFRKRLPLHFMEITKTLNAAQTHTANNNTAGQEIHYHF